MAKARNLPDVAYGIAAYFEGEARAGALSRGLPSAAIQEIVRGVASAATGRRACPGRVQGVSENAVGLRRGAAQTGTASAQVLAAARGLARGSDELDQGVKASWRRSRRPGRGPGAQPAEKPRTAARTSASIIGRTSSTPRGPRPPRSAR